MKKYRTTFDVRLTLAELQALDSCLGNGWGEGDFAEWLNDPKAEAALKRGWNKLGDAIKMLHACQTTRQTEEAK